MGPFSQIKGLKQGPLFKNWFSYTWASFLKVEILFQVNYSAMQNIKLYSFLNFLNRYLKIFLVGFLKLGGPSVSGP